jgi:four helix bundle protein
MGWRKADVEDLKDRMKRFGLAIIRLADKLPPGRAAGVIANQLVRSATSAGANYRAACRARSKADLISKMGVVEEELDETLYWLEMSVEAGFLARSDAESLIKEADELLRIVVSSIRTAKGVAGIPHSAFDIPH